MHTLYNLETQIPTFFHITPAKVHDTKAMDAIPYEENSFYIFDRGYNDFKPMKWKCRFPTGSGIQSDARPNAVRFPGQGNVFDCHKPGKTKGRPEDRPRLNSI